MKFHFCSRCLAAAGLTIFALPVFSQTDDPQHDEDRLHGQAHQHDTLEEVVVRATPLGRDVVEMSQSATVLGIESLAREAANNIGDTLARQPGLANASFGANVGRPVIRGLQGARVGILNDNMGASDASAVSQDHAVATEPFIADQVEVLRGPATLLYGSGAIGGVVNLVTNAIPEQLPEQAWSGRGTVHLDSASNQRLGAARIDMSGDHFAGHANAFYRRSNDYEIPEDAHLELTGEAGHDEDEITGKLENSFLDNQGGTLGGAWIGESWTAGLSWTAYDSDYGIPGGHGHHEHDEADDAEEEEEENVVIGLESRRIDGRVTATNPFRGIESLRFNFADTGYTHTEFEGDEIGTVFENDTRDARLEIKHQPWGNWQGAFGLQSTHRDFLAAGEEAFVPPSSTRTKALFWVESLENDRFRLDLGARLDQVDIRTLSAVNGASHAYRDFQPFSASAALVFHAREGSHFSVTLANAERAPSDGELFSRGPHIATRTYEIGDSELTVETNTHYEVAYRAHQGAVTGSVTVYHDDFSDYIYEADTGVLEDDLPVRQWSQQDAEFSGAEIELRWDIGHRSNGHWQMTGFHDRVRARLADGSRVPRIPPKRFGVGLEWDHEAWAGNLTWIRASRHSRTAQFETPTPGYHLVNAELSYLFNAQERSDIALFLKVNNLLNEDIRHSTSFLKDMAPQAGRNFTIGIRAGF